MDLIQNLKVLAGRDSDQLVGKLLERSLSCFQSSREKTDNIASQCPQQQINQSSLDNVDTKQGSSINSEHTD